MRGWGQFGKGGRSANKFRKSQIRKYILFFLTNIAYGALIQRLLGLWQSCELFCRNSQICDLEIKHRTCVFAICGLTHLRNLRICYCGMGPRICGFAICGVLKENYFSLLQIRRQQKSMDIFQYISSTYQSNNDDPKLNTLRWNDVSVYIFSYTRICFSYTVLLSIIVSHGN